MLLDFLTSAVSGGLLGGILPLGKLFHAYKEKKLMFAHEVAMASETRQNLALEMELAQIKGELALELSESQDDAKNLQAAIAAEATSKGSSPWVQDLKASTRPFLTYGLCIIAALIVTFDSTNPWANEFIFMATTAVTFWFGDRPRRTR